MYSRANALTALYSPQLYHIVSALATLITPYKALHDLEINGQHFNSNMKI